MSSNPKPFRIRRAEPQDVEAMFGLICELADYEKMSYQVTGSVAALESCLFGSRPVAEALVAEVEGSLVGQALFFTTFSTFLTQPGHYLEDLYVQPAYRQQGIGQALLVALAQLTLKRGYGRLEWMVLDWNTPAIEFYRKIGADQLTDWIPNRVTGEALQRLAQG